jgi:hypothetical protein
MLREASYPSDPHPVATWGEPDCYLQHPADTYKDSTRSGTMSVAVWAPAPNRAQGLGLASIDAGFPKQAESPFMSSAIESIVRIADASPGAENLLAILGIAAAVKYDTGAQYKAKRAHMVSTFPSIPTFNARLRWINQQLDPRDTPPTIVATHGIYSNEQFMEHWSNDEVLMSAAQSTPNGFEAKSTLYAAHDMLAHGIAWAALTSVMRQAIRSNHLPLGVIDGLVAIPSVQDMLEPSELGSQVFVLASHGVLDDRTGSNPDSILGQQLARFDALKTLPQSPFSNPHDVLALAA